MITSKFQMIPNVAGRFFFGVALCTSSYTMLSYNLLNSFSSAFRYRNTRSVGIGILNQKKRVQRVSDNPLESERTQEQSFD